MATKQSDQTAVNYHKRIAMGEKLDGTSLGQKQQQPKTGALEQVKKKK